MSYGKCLFRYLFFFPYKKELKQSRGKILSKVENVTIPITSALNSLHGTEKVSTFTEKFPKIRVSILYNDIEATQHAYLNSEERETT